MKFWQRALTVLLILATGGLVVATAFALLARLWWLFDLFTHFRLQYVAAALALAGLALVLGRPKTASLLGLIALLHGWTIRDLWLGGEVSVADAGLPLRVVSANVLASNPTPGKVADFVQASEAGLVVLVDAQGERWAGALEQLAEAYPYGAPAGWQDGAPVIVLSQAPIRDVRVIRSLAGRRPYLVAEVMPDGAPPILVAAVHPSSPSAVDATDTWWRNLELAYMAESLDEVQGPVIVAGDFNTTPWSPHMADLMAETDLRHAAAGAGYLGTWPRWFWPVRIPIDHVLVKGPIRVAGIALGPEIGSDHFPLVADLRLLEP